MKTRLLGCALLLGVATFSVWPILAPIHASITPAIARDLLSIDFGSSLLAAPFLIVNALVCTAVAVWGYKRGSPADGWRLSLFGGAMVGVLLAQSVVAFLLCWEAMSLISAFLVATYSTRRSVRRAVFSYVLISQLATLCITAVLAVLAVHAGGGSFSGIAAAKATLPDGMRTGLLLLAVVGFGAKAGLVPLQFWLPQAHPAAPANASALLSGVMLKIAAYGLLLVTFVLAAPAPWSIGIALLVAGLLSALLGSLYATIESEIKRLLAFSSIEHIGIIVTALGLAILASSMNEPALAALALVAFIFHIVSHATFKSLLFLAAGTLNERLQVTNLDQLGGLATSVMRRSAPWILIGCMAAAALPPFIGFSSEWLVFDGFIKALGVGSPLFKAFAAVGIAALATTGGLGAAAFVKLYGAGFLGQERHPRPVEPERFDASVLALAFLACACVVVGMFPLLVIAPAARIAAELSGTTPLSVPTIPWLPALATLPILGGIVSLVVARRRGVREAGTWTCGSPVTPRSQYTATVLSKPIRLIFGFALFPQRERRIDYGSSRWIPTHISYALSTRYVIDEVARAVAAFVQRLSRRTRVFQGGLLRVYLGYALAALLAALAVAR
ncbi:MAG TPA: proton-conducting transporter membrane subunit [Candidatus Baltobacteraceae bacterium]|nr:proton-conducting transporter membrane subunit [Candidatus Baltobacteraceae bacterium]